MDLIGKRVLVLGLGETGLSMARWIARQGGAVRVADTREAPPALGALRAAVPQAEVVTGPFTDALLGGVDLVAVSPGVPPAEPVVQAALARGLEVVGDVELFARYLATLPGAQRGRVIAITGTNGKTTVTALTGAMCRAARLETVVAGNICPRCSMPWSRGSRPGACPRSGCWSCRASSWRPRRACVPTRQRC